MEKKEYNFNTDGIEIHYGFLNEIQINELRKECDFLFSKLQLNGHGFSVRLSKTVKEVTYPSAHIHSVNLLEVAIDISKKINEIGYQKYKLANIALYHEENNPNELVWHSDMRNGGLIRAQIVIKGGELNSGAFRYYLGSQEIASPDHYYPSEGYLQTNKENMIICNKINGSLFLINTLGYHSKCVCVEPRVSLMFDFLPLDYIISNPNDVSSEIHLISSKLTEKVVENISLFQSMVLPGTKSQNTADFYKFNKILAGSNLKDLCKFFLTLVRR